MPKIERRDNLPEAVRSQFLDRPQDRAITIADLNPLRLWIDTNPEVSEVDRYEDFGSF